MISITQRRTTCNFACGVKTRNRRAAACILPAQSGGDECAVLPAVLTIGIVVWVAGFVHRLIGRGTIVGNGLQSLGLKFVANSTTAYVIGWTVVLVAIFSLGLLAQMGAKRFSQRLFDAVASRVPLVGSIYGTSKQLVSMFDRKDESEIKAMSVVWCFFGKEAAGVLALMPTPERFRMNGLMSIYVSMGITAPQFLRDQAQQTKSA